MASITLDERNIRTGGGSRSPINHRDYGGGGGGGGGGSDAPDYGERLRRYRLGMAIALVAILLVFVSFSAVFLARANAGRWDAATGTYVRDQQPLQLPLELLAINTALLAISSIALELARHQVAERALLAPLNSIPGIAVEPKRKIPWLGLSAAFGTAFLAGQTLAWRALLIRDPDIYDRASSSFFYVLTGTHAIHIFAGLCALLYASATTSLLSKPVEIQRIVVEITAWFWHAMTLVWIGLFALLALA